MLSVSIVLLAAAVVAVGPLDTWAWQPDDLRIVGVKPAIHDQVRTLAVDLDGDVVAAGYFKGPGPVLAPVFGVCKLSGSSGDVRWCQDLTDDLGLDFRGTVRAVVLDPAGDVFAAGSGADDDPPRVNGFFFTVAKLAGDSGRLLWVEQPRAPGGEPSQDSGEARAIAVDGTGAVVTAGILSSSGATRTFVVVKHSARGAPLWLYGLMLPEPRFLDVARALAVDRSDDVVAAGFAVSRARPLFSDFIVVKLGGADGTERWRRTIDGTAGFARESRGKFSRTALVTSQEPLLYGLDVRVRAVDFTSDAADAVAIDGAGDVVAAGTTLNRGTGFDFTVAKLSGSTGEEFWRRTIDGGGRGMDRSFALALDANGDIVAAGYLTRAGRDSRFAVVKFRGSSGEELWRRTIDGTARGGRAPDKAFSVMLDAQGDVIAAGVTANARTFNDLTVVKLRGADGDILWHRAVDGTRRREVFSTDNALAVAVDGSGDVVAGGTIDGDFGIVKLRSADGTDFSVPDLASSGPGP